VGVILDTCIWIGIADKQVSKEAVLAKAGEMEVFISVISLGELSFGVEACTEPLTRLKRTRYLRTLESRPNLEVSALTASEFGVLAAFVKQAGRSPRPRYNDLWIAAQAIEHDYSLLTLNEDDFAWLPGLKILTP
jgi:predicted nucleic acid-binding protein